MAEFRSYRSYWDFAFTVTKQWRYSLPEDQQKFVETVLATSADKVQTLQTAFPLFRAQVGHDWQPEDLGGGVTEDFECAFPPERMKPRRDRAYEGRANPKGIPCLYVATRVATAVAESRPWVGALVSVAQLRISRPLRVLNCTTDDQRRLVYSQEPPPAEREKAVWQDIDRAFAEPVSRTDEVASYAPTQLLAEAFRHQGLDGIGYRSAMGDGHNLALFDLDAADVVSCTLFRVDGMKLDYRQVANTYFVAKYFPSLKATVKADDGEHKEPDTSTSETSSPPADAE